MDHMPWYDIFLVSFPEAIVFLSLGLVLIGFELKSNVKLIALIAISYSIISYPLQLLLPAGINPIVQLIVVIFMVKYILKLKFPSSILAVIVGSAILLIFEGFSLFFMSSFINLSYEKISNDPLLFIIVPNVDFSLLFLLTLLIRAKNITLLPLLNKIKLKKLQSNLALTLVILFLAILLNIVYFSTFVINNGSFTIKQGIKLSTILFLLLIIIIGFTIKKLINVTETQAVIETHEVYLKNLQELYTGLRSQRHDFTNQIQVIHGLLGLNKFEAAKEFSTELCQHLADLNKVVQVDDPVLAALLQAKMSFAGNNHVDFTLDVQTKLDKLAVTPLEFTKITGNLLDNAFDATMQLSEENRQVGFALKCVDNSYIIEVSNTCYPIPPKMLNKIFTGGVTTKEKHTGLGLSIVKKLIDSYKGDIKVTSYESETVFTVSLPCSMHE